MARLIHRFPVEPYGGLPVGLADLDGDGRDELLILQSAGQLRAAFYTNPRLGIEAADRTLHGLTAVRLDGTVVWQNGAPYSRPGVPFTTHGGSGMVKADDLDGDGIPEVLVIHGDELQILDGPTGRVRRSVRLPGDNFSRIATAQLGPPGRGRQIIVRVNDRSHPPWEYANPTMVFNADLSVYREPFAVRGAGHNVVARDINGDGRDELFLGYSLLDHELRPLWSLDFGPGFDYEKDHADEIALADLNGDGVPEVRYAGSEDFVVASLEGRVLWTARAGHSQNSVQGPWGPDGEERVILNEKNRGLHGLDARGNLLWSRPDLNGYARHNVRWSQGPGQRCWAVFEAHRRPVLDALPYTSDPAWSRELWPHFIGGNGELHDIFPWDERYAIPAGVIRAARGYDAGLGYPTLAADLNGDGLDEILVVSRQQVWLFASPEAEPLNTPFSETHRTRGS
jgi:outer membrane protein assembly factor BamB